jgi:hypothetical protein
MVCISLENCRYLLAGIASELRAQTEGYYICSSLDPEI